MPYPDSEYPSILRGRDKRESQRLLAAAPDLLAALRDAVEFIRGSNECLGPVSSNGDREWVDYCVELQSSCESAIAKAEGRE